MLKHFSGYTVTTGNISGYWKGENGREQYGEHREYKVAFSNHEKIVALENYIARLASEIGEETVYFEIDDRAWLLHACPV